VEADDVVDAKVVFDVVVVVVVVVVEVVVDAVVVAVVEAAVAVVKVIEQSTLAAQSHNIPLKRVPVGHDKVELDVGPQLIYFEQSPGYL